MLGNILKLSLVIWLVNLSPVAFAEGSSEHGDDVRPTERDFDDENANESVLRDYRPDVESASREEQSRERVRKFLLGSLIFFAALPYAARVIFWTIDYFRYDYVLPPVPTIPEGPTGYRTGIIAGQRHSILHDVCNCDRCRIGMQRYEESRRRL